ncbi:RusA family crossover junction endodeoxyribonuclease [Burkholderia sp. JPY481]
MSPISSAPKAIVVTLPYPISANRYWASRIVKPKSGPSFVSTYVTPEAKAYKEQVGWIFRAGGVHEPIAGRVDVALKLYPKRPQDWESRKRKLGANWDDGVMCIDLDNAVKVLMDSIKGIAILEDGWPVRRILLERAEPDGEARVVLTITPLSAQEGPAQAELVLADPLEVV